MSTLRDEGRKRAIERLMNLYDDTYRILQQSSRRGKMVETLGLLISILTTGTLWMLITEAIPRVVLWFGAFASSVTTAPSIVPIFRDFPKKRMEALTLYQEIGQFIAAVRASQDVLSEDYWASLKRFETKIADLKN